MIHILLWNLKQDMLLFDETTRPSDEERERLKYIIKNEIERLLKQKNAK